MMGFSDLEEEYILLSQQTAETIDSDGDDTVRVIISIVTTIGADGTVTTSMTCSQRYYC